MVRLSELFCTNLLLLCPQALASEFSYEPAVERRGAFVGLQNAGATCYMNSVLQQLFLTPNISDQGQNSTSDIFWVELQL